MEHYHKTVDAILEAGHEIGHHSWVHEDPMNHSDEKEAELFGRVMDAHNKIAGRSPLGYRAPVYNITPAIVNRLIRHEFLYDSSMMADDLPYKVITSAGSIIELPPHWGNDDWPPFAHMEELEYVMPVRSPSDGIKSFIEEYEAMYEAGGFWMPVLPPFLTGRLARWREMERHLERILEQGDVWIAPMKEIAE